MLKTTSQQIIDRIGVGPEEVGRPVVLGSNPDLNPTTGGNSVLKSIPKGYVLAVTKVTAQAAGAFGISGAVGTKDALLGSPHSGAGGTAGHYQVDFEQTAGDADQSLRFQRFARYNTVFGTGSSPDFRNSHPSNVAQWEPKYPLIVPSEWTADSRDDSSAAYGEAVAGCAVYGVLISEGDALQLGLCTTNTSPASERFMGFTSSIGTGGTETLVAAKTGYGIRILDIYIRFQPSTNTDTTVSLVQNDGTRTILKWTNSNPNEPIEESLSPDIFLKSGSALDLVTTTADVQSVCVSYEYVEEREIPNDHFWGEIHPTFGTPAAGTTGTGSCFTTAISEMTLYYPGLDGTSDRTSSSLTVTATTPGTGKQHLVRGFSISAQKSGSGTGTTDDADQSAMALVGGQTGLTDIGFSHTSAIAQITGDATVELLSPLLLFTEHDQNLTYSEDRVSLPIKADDGVVRVDVLGWAADAQSLTGTLTPSNDGSVEDWSVSVWGRTIPTTFTAPISRTF